MAYSAFAVANAFIQRAWDRGISDLSPMKLQKLMYFAQAWHLKIRNEPLLDDHFARWQHLRGDATAQVTGLGRRDSCGKSGGSGEPAPSAPHMPALL